MKSSRRAFVSGMAGLAVSSVSPKQQNTGGVVKYVRYEQRGKVSYGILAGETIKQIRGDLFGNRAETGVKLKLNEVKLLWPCEPTKVLAVGLNMFRGQYGTTMGDGSQQVDSGSWTASRK